MTRPPPTMLESPPLNTKVGKDWNTIHRNDAILTEDDSTRRETTTSSINKRHDWKTYSSINKAEETKASSINKPTILVDDNLGETKTSSINKPRPLMTNGMNIGTGTEAEEIAQDDGGVSAVFEDLLLSWLS